MASNGSFATSQYQPASEKGSYSAPSAPRPSVPQIPGKDDLEKLENLKRIIKAGQHEFYRAIPQPEALAKLYMGIIPDSVPQNGEQQIPAASPTGGKADAKASSPTSPVGSSSRHPRYHNKGANNGPNRRLSATNGSSQNGAMNNGHVSNANQGQGTGSQNGLAASTSEGKDVTSTQQDVATTKPPGLPVKPDVSQPSLDRVRVDSSAGRPASLPDKPNTDGRVGPGPGWQGRNDPGRSDIYDRPPPPVSGSPGQERSWSERKPHDRYAREGLPVKTEELPISLSDSATRPASGPADSRPGFPYDSKVHDFPRFNEPTNATEPLPQSVPGLSEADGQPRSFPSAGPLRRESYPPQESKLGSDVPPKDLHSSPQPNGIGLSPHNRANYPPRAPSPKRDGPPSKSGPSPGSNQAQSKYARPYRPPPNNYRPDYGDSVRRTDRMDVDEPRYADRSYRPYSPPLDPSRDRGRALPPSPGRSVSEYDDPRRYSNAPPPPPAGYGSAPPPAGYGGQPSRWEDDPYYKSRASHWDPSLDRDRYERDPARGTWDARAERDPRGYSRGPPGAPPVDDRYAYRDVDRNSRPPSAAVPPYSRTRPRSPSPMRRGGGPMVADDPRPPLKRPRDDYGPPPHHPSAAPPGGDYYSPRNPDMARGRPPPGSADSYGSAPPSSGPPPPSGGSGSFYDRTGPPPPSSSSMGSERDRDYMRGMDYASPLPPPQHAGYGRPRSPPPGSTRMGPSSSSMAYDNRAPYARGPPPPPASNGRDGRSYGMPPPRP